MPVWRPPTGTRGSLETTWRGRLRRSTRTSLVHGASTPNRSKITETTLIRAYALERTTGIEPAFSAWEDMRRYPNWPVPDVWRGRWCPIVTGNDLRLGPVWGPKTYALRGQGDAFAPHGQGLRHFLRFQE